MIFASLTSFLSMESQIPEVDMPNLITYLNDTPLFEGYVVRRDSRKRHQKTCI
jgi:hypothetical protein